MNQPMPERIPGGGIDLSHLAARGQAGQGPGPAAGAAGGADAPAGAPPVVDVPSLVIDLNDDTFEQAAQLSTIVPVVIDLWAASSVPSQENGKVLAKVTRELAGRVMLARVEVEANPGLAQAFQVQSVPMVVALVGGRPVPLFQGAVSESEVAEFFGQLLQLAEQHGVSGRVNAPADGANSTPEAPAEPEIPAAHLAAVEAGERGDYATAIAEWEAVLQKAPADAVARAALVQVRLLSRLDGLTVDEIRGAAAADPGDVAAQLRVADLDVSGGHVEDSFLRLLELFSTSSDEDRSLIRERLLELFEVVGVADSRVIAARGQLANLLY